MSLKILVVPFSILMSLILVIGYVKPDITVLQDKRVALDTKVSQSQNMDTLLSNIDALDASLNKQEEAERSVGLFLPQAIDEERVIDMFNYLGAQSGVFVYVMGMKEVVPKGNKEEAVLTPAEAPLVTGANNGPAPVVAPIVSFKPKVKSYSAQVEVKGGYANIRDFFNRLAHMNRFHKVTDFTIATPATEKDADPNVLTGTFESQFDYFPLQTVDSALNIPVFSRSTFNTDELDELLAWINYTVPALTGSETGRTNPFQP